MTLWGYADCTYRINGNANEEIYILNIVKNAHFDKIYERWTSYMGRLNRTLTACDNRKALFVQAENVRPGWPHPSINLFLSVENRELIRSSQSIVFHVSSSALRYIFPPRTKCVKTSNPCRLCAPFSNWVIHLFNVDDLWLHLLLAEASLRLVGCQGRRLLSFLLDEMSPWQKGNSWKINKLRMRLEWEVFY